MSNTARLELEHGCDFEEQRQFRLAFDCYLKSAEHGNIKAQVNLANLLDEGKGCQKDSVKAVYWYTQAANAGCAEAAYNLGVHYQKLNNRKLSKYWFKVSAEMGDEDAHLELSK